MLDFIKNYWTQIIFIIGIIIGFIKLEWAYREGTKCSLRNDILTLYYKCCEKGYRNDYDYQNIHEMYDAYQELDGNSFIKDIMKRFDELPVKESTVPTKTVERKTKKQVLNEEI